MLEQLRVLAEALIDAGSRGRQELLEAELRREQLEAHRADLEKEGFYAKTQTARCLCELDERADLVWRSFVRVITESRTQWDGSMKEMILARVREQLDRDAAYIEPTLRSLIADRHGFNIPLTSAKPGILARVDVELQLFALRYQPSPSSLSEQLSAPRYRAAKLHFEKSAAFLVTDPPDYPNAVKEATCVVEAIAKLVSGEPSATLGKCLQRLKGEKRIDPLEATAIEALWAESNQLPGARHAQNTDVAVSEGRARYWVESAFSAAKRMLELDR